MGNSVGCRECDMWGTVWSVGSVMCGGQGGVSGV